MCSIVGTANTIKLKVLADLNKTRGTFSHSVFYISMYDLSLHKHSFKSFGELDINKLEIPKNHFAIVHQQAPTTAIKSDKFIHPSQIDNCYLWHNGIIKPSTCALIKARDYANYNAFQLNKEWDTQLLHLQLYYDDNFDNIDGSFACLHYCENEFLNVFRNEIAPLYFDGDTFSSLKFVDSEELPPNKVFNVFFEEESLSLEEIQEFKTYNNPYFFGE